MMTYQSQLGLMQLFPPPVFDHMPYASTEGEGLGCLVMCGDVRWTDGRHMAGQCPTVIPILCRPCRVLLTDKGSLQMLWPTALTWTLQKGFERLHLVLPTLCLPDITARDPGLPTLSHLYLHTAKTGG